MTHPEKPMPGINIYSGEGGLGGALTNPTELAYRKGNLSERYPVRYAGRIWADAEEAYHALKSGSCLEADRVMIEIIAAKFQQYPELAKQVRDRGGSAFLQTCSHHTGARSQSARSWEGQGMRSRFIRNLTAGFQMSEDGAVELGQRPLF